MRANVMWRGRNASGGGRVAGSRHRLSTILLMHHEGDGLPSTATWRDGRPIARTTSWAAASVLMRCRMTLGWT